MTHRTAQHPVFRIVMRDQGRSLVWLARETGFSHPYVKAVSAGIEKGSPRFREACARVLGMSEDALFHGQADSNAAPVREGELVGRSSTAVRALYGTDGSLSIGIPDRVATPSGGAAGD